MLRIVSGRFRGRKLVTPEAAGVRPTADRMKESVFNILQASVAQSRVLDLYAGAGNLGLEALSRGARQVLFVERNAAALLALRKNLANLGLSGITSRQISEPAADQGEVEVIAGDAIRFLQNHVGDPFDLILADPPYESAVEETFLKALRKELLVPGGMVVFQHRGDWHLQALPEGFEAQRPRKFGKTVIDFLKRREGIDV